MSEETKQDRIKKRGFGSIPAERRKEIASLGGKAAHEKGRAHEFTPGEAAAAGRKGGAIVSQNRKHMSEIGRIGGATKRENSLKRGAPAVETPSEAECTAEDLQDSDGSRGAGGEE